MFNNTGSETKTFFSNKSGCLPDVALNLVPIKGAAPYNIAIAAPGIARVLEYISGRLRISGHKNLCFLFKFVQGEDKHGRGVLVPGKK